jgi:hypothetical protein
MISHERTRRTPGVRDVAEAAFKTGTPNLRKPRRPGLPFQMRRNSFLYGSFVMWSSTSKRMGRLAGPDQRRTAKSDGQVARLRACSTSILDR